MRRAIRRFSPLAHPALRVGAPALATRRGNTAAPLDAAVRRDMQARFAQDFSAVRVRTDATATRALRADAYAVGPDIVFAPNRFAPTTPAGRGLLAHELAHVVQQRLGTAAPQAVSRAGDADEHGANQAVNRIAAGQVPRLQPAQSGLHRQLAGAAPPPPLPMGLMPPQQSQAEALLESFLNRMWAAQSDRKPPFRLTPKVMEGLALFFPLGVPLGVVTDFDSVQPVLDTLRPRLPQSLGAPQAAVLDRLPEQEKKLPTSARKPQGDPTKPAFAPPGTHSLPDATTGKPPGGSDLGAAAGKALEAALAEFRRTELGKQLEKAAKSYVFSKEGIPLVLLVTAGALTFVAANDPKLPATPDIPIGEGIKLKLELSRASDLPPLVRDLVHDHTEPPGTPERKAMISATVSFEALAEGGKAAGHLVGEAANWIERGAVHAGTVIGQHHSFLLPALGAAAGGAAIGSGIGALAGGGIGAALGALIGAGVGLGAALIAHEVSQP
jgi:hypothetical protein